jgi:GNAT superfamily N-acetyltransferase
VTLAIRPARPEDYEALCALFDELDEFHRQARPDFFRPFDGPPRARDVVERWRSGPGSTVLVAEARGEVVGLAVLLRRMPSGFAGAVARGGIELDNLVMRSDWRSRRVGRRLLDAVLDWSRGQGASHVEVAVHAFNRDARRFYKRFGFAASIDRLVLVA